jgi:hypothetical protein
MTNAEKIRSKTDTAELAEFLERELCGCPASVTSKECDGIPNCQDCLAKWLSREVEE